MTTATNPHLRRGPGFATAAPEAATLDPETAVAASVALASDPAASPQPRRASAAGGIVTMLHHPTGYNLASWPDTVSVPR